MTVTAPPPEAPRPSPGQEPVDVEAQEALIKEARRRARRRQMGYAASTLAVFLFESNEGEKNLASHP